MAIWGTIGEHIAAATTGSFSITRHRSAGGGCINTAYVVEGSGQCYFVKTNDARLAEMFEAEAAGLQEIIHANVIKAPSPVCWGIAGSQAFLVLEHIEMGDGSATAASALGQQLSHMHRVTRSHFGWLRDNTIGSTPQRNTPAENWVGFWREQRLGFQLDLALRRGAGAGLRKAGEQLLSRFDALFSNYTPQPSLLHGDLWGGNYAVTRSGAPVIFDPAVYFGDREADLAMTELFGGFPRRFYDAYNEAWPLDPGYRTRKTLYNLYHVLNHFNMFGGGYASQAQGMAERLLAEVR